MYLSLYVSKECDSWKFPQQYKMHEENEIFPVTPNE